MSRRFLFYSRAGRADAHPPAPRFSEITLDSDRDFSKARIPSEGAVTLR